MDAVVEVKKSVINDFFNYIECLKTADYSMDVSHMLAKILFIESAIELDKFQYLYEKLS